MKILTKLVAVVLTAGAMQATTALAVITVTLSDTPYNNTSYGGGEFSAVSNFDFKQFYNPAATYDPVGPVGVGFGTFCLEFTEHISYNTTYYAKINYGAVSGGSSGGDVSPIVNGMDQISKGTAWLYSQYASGTLAGYNYNTTLAARQESSKFLQLAIWYLEGEVSLSFALQSTVNPFLSSVTNKFGSYAAAAANSDKIQYGSAWGVEYGVVALNLYTGYNATTGEYTGKAQDQLAIIPEPATVIAGLMLLLPFGASMVRILRKKQESQPPFASRSLGEMLGQRRTPSTVIPECRVLR